MATKVVVAGSNVSASQLKDLFRQIEDGSINSRRLQAFLDHQNPWDDSRLPDLNWRVVYEKLGLSREFEEFYQNQPLAEADDGEHWKIPVLVGVTPNRVVAAMRELSVEFYLFAEDLDQAVPKNDRGPNRGGSYLVRFARTVEADPELANQSADDLARDSVPGITLLERLLLGFAYFLATGEHLDIDNITLCSGSRDSGGGVPSVHWDAFSRKVYVRWYYSSDRDGDLRSRVVVS